MFTMYTRVGVFTELQFLGLRCIHPRCSFYGTTVFTLHTPVRVFMELQCSGLRCIDMKFFRATTVFTSHKHVCGCFQGLHTTVCFRRLDVYATDKCLCFQEFTCNCLFQEIRCLLTNTSVVRGIHTTVCFRRLGVY